jgi:hypothetical protein
MQRFIVVFGLTLFLVGLAWPLVTRIGLGRLPGDIVIELGSLKLYLPVATSVLLSLIMSALLWLLAR